MRVIAAGGLLVQERTVLWRVGSDQQPSAVRTLSRLELARSHRLCVHRSANVVASGVVRVYAMGVQSFHQYLSTPDVLAFFRHNCSTYRNLTPKI